MTATLIRLFLLTLIWVALQGTLSVGNVVLGILFAGAILRVSQPLLKSTEHSTSSGEGKRFRLLPRIWRMLVLLLVFLRELLISALQVVRFTLQPSLKIRPAIVEYPLDVETPREITVLANLISLTPGTLSLDVSTDREYLYVHAISVSTDNGADVIAEIKNTLEKHVGRALGPRD